jgi:hypothetical protein
MRRRLFIVLLTLIIFINAVFNTYFVHTAIFNISTTAVKASSGGFITRRGTQLLLNGRPFRFAGTNMHWLPMGDNTTFYTSQFQINDGLATAREMGFTVVRSHDLGISTGCANCIEPSLGVFNQVALAHDDYVIKAARDRGIRLIIPFTDNYHYPAGGKHNFTDWRKISNENQFFYNKQVMQDFEKYISVLLNHVNVYTGVAYKNDPTIMAWETGNELQPPASWTSKISSYIKSIDKNHLVVDGSARVDPAAGTMASIDIVSNHYYPRSISRFSSDAALAKKLGKAFIVGEFDWNKANGGDALDRFLAAIEARPSVAGDVFWELWPHNDYYGYVSGQPKYMLHYPGDTAAMRTSAQQLRTHAYKMRAMAIPPAMKMATPVISTAIRSDQKIVLSWRGIVGAASYSIERSTKGMNGPWTVICSKCATDNVTPWADKSPPAGMLWYRLRAYNLSGIAGGASIPYEVGAAVTSGQALVDNLNDWHAVYAHSKNLSFDVTHSENMHGDTSRAARLTRTNEWIIWQQQNTRLFQAIGYYWPYEPISQFSFYTSVDGNSWTTVTPTVGVLPGIWHEYVYVLPNLSGVNYVKVMWNNTGGQIWNPQLGQVTISH